jgi:hypothetical protein
MISLEEIQKIFLADIPEGQAKPSQFVMIVDKANPKNVIVNMTFESKDATLKQSMQLRRCCYVCLMATIITGAIQMIDDVEIKSQFN